MSADGKFTFFIVVCCLLAFVGIGVRAYIYVKCPKLNEFLQKENERQKAVGKNMLKGGIIAANIASRFIKK